MATTNPGQIKNGVSAKPRLGLFAVHFLILIFFSIALSGCLSTEGRLEVKVVDSEGNPVLANVEVYDNGILVAINGTDESGSALFTLDPGSYEISAEQGSSKSPKIEAVVEANAKVVKIVSLE